MLTFPDLSNSELIAKQTDGDLRWPHMTSMKVTDENLQLATFSSAWTGLGLAEEPGDCLPEQL